MGRMDTESLAYSAIGFAQRAASPGCPSGLWCGCAWLTGLVRPSGGALSHTALYLIQGVEAWRPLERSEMPVPTSTLT